MKELGFQEATDKACPLSMIMEFLGIEFHTKTLTLHVTPKELSQINMELSAWTSKTKATKTPFPVTDWETFYSIMPAAGIIL